MSRTPSGVVLPCGGPARPAGAGLQQRAAPGPRPPPACPRARSGRAAAPRPARARATRRGPRRRRGTARPPPGPLARRRAVLVDDGDAADDDPHLRVADQPRITGTMSGFAQPPIFTSSATVPAQQPSLGPTCRSAAAPTAGSAPYASAAPGQVKRSPAHPLGRRRAASGRSRPPLGARSAAAPPRGRAGRARRPGRARGRRGRRRRASSTPSGRRSRTDAA